MVLSETVGPYPTGANLSDVLADMSRRLGFLQSDWAGLQRFAANAWLTPSYGLGASGFVALDAFINGVLSATIGLDAVLAAPVSVSRSDSLALSAFLLSQTVATTQLSAPIDATQTTITVTNDTSFPSGDFLIQIDDEIMLVIGGQGTGTWTVIRGYAGTTAAPHGSGALTVAC